MLIRRLALYTAITLLLSLTPTSAPNPIDTFNRKVARLAVAGQRYERHWAKYRQAFINYKIRRQMILDIRASDADKQLKEELKYWGLAVVSSSALYHQRLEEVVDASVQLP